MFFLGLVRTLGGLFLNCDNTAEVAAWTSFKKKTNLICLAIFFSKLAKISTNIFFAVTSGPRCWLVWFFCWRKIKWTENVGFVPWLSKFSIPCARMSHWTRHNGSVFSAVLLWVKTYRVHRRISIILLHGWASCQAPFYPPHFASEGRKQIGLYWFRTQPSSFESQGSVWVNMAELVVHLGSTW